MCQNDARLVEQELNSFTKWQEKVELTQTKGIRIEDFPNFLEHFVRTNQTFGKSFYLFCFGPGNG